MSDTDFLRQRNSAAIAKEHEEKMGELMNQLGKETNPAPFHAPVPGGGRAANTGQRRRSSISERMGSLIGGGMSAEEKAVKKAEEAAKKAKKEKAKKKAAEKDLAKLMGTEYMDSSEEESDGEARDVDLPETFSSKGSAIVAGSVSISKDVFGPGCNATTRKSKDAGADDAFLSKGKATASSEMVNVMGITRTSLTISKGEVRTKGGEAGDLSSSSMRLLAKSGSTVNGSRKSGRKNSASLKARLDRTYSQERRKQQEALAADKSFFSDKMNLLRYVPKKLFDSAQWNDRKEAQRALRGGYRWHLLPPEKMKRLTIKKEKTLDIVSGRERLSICAQISFAMAFGFLIGFLGALVVLFEKKIHKLMEHISESMSSTFLTCLFWTCSAALSGGSICFLTHTYLPECLGSGMDVTKVSMALNAPIRGTVTIYRMIATPLYMGFGNTLGLEAPFMHGIAGSVSCFLSILHRLFPSRFRMEDLTTWELVVSTAALGCVFYSPLAGMVFAIELLINYRKIGAAFTLVGLCCVTACFAIIESTRVFNRYFSHRNVDWQESVLYHKYDNAILLPTGAVMGVLCAIIGQTYVEIIIYLTRLVNNFRGGKYKRYWGFPASIVVGILGSINYSVNKDWGVWAPGWGTLEKILCTPFCQEQAYYSVHPEFKMGIQHMECYTAKFYIVFFLCKSAAVIISASTGGPGGLLFPSIVLGTSFGGIVSCVLSDIAPEYAHDWRLCMMMGTVGIYTSMMRTPITSMFVCIAVMGFQEKGLVVGIIVVIMITAMISFAMTCHLQRLDMDERKLLVEGFDLRAIWRYGSKLVLNSANVDEKHHAVTAAREAVRRQAKTDCAQMHRICKKHDVKTLLAHLSKTRCNTDALEIKVNLFSSPQTILCKCIESNHANAVHMLLYHGANPNLPGRDQELPLHVCCRIAGGILMAISSSFGATGSNFGGGQRTRKTNLVGMSNVGKVNLLADQHTLATKELDKQDGKQRNEDLRTTRMLNNGVIVRNILGETVNTTAALYQTVDCIKRLLSYQADVNARSSQHGQTALHMCVDIGFEEGVAVLLSAKADPTQQDNQLATPIELALEPRIAERVQKGIAKFERRELKAIDTIKRLDAAQKEAQREAARQAGLDQDPDEQDPGGTRGDQNVRVTTTTVGSAASETAASVGATTLGVGSSTVGASVHLLAAAEPSAALTLTSYSTSIKLGADTSDEEQPPEEDLPKKLKQLRKRIVFSDGNQSMTLQASSKLGKTGMGSGSTVESGAGSVLRTESDAKRSKCKESTSKSSHGSDGELLKGLSDKAVKIASKDKLSQDQPDQAETSKERTASTEADRRNDDTAQGSSVGKDAAVDQRSSAQSKPSQEPDPDKVYSTVSGSPQGGAGPSGGVSGSPASGKGSFGISASLHANLHPQKGAMMVASVPSTISNNSESLKAAHAANLYSMHSRAQSGNTMLNMNQNLEFEIARYRQEHGLGPDVELCSTINLDWGEPTMEKRVRVSGTTIDEFAAIIKEKVGDTVYENCWDLERVSKLYTQELDNQCELRVQNDQVIFRHVQIAQLLVQKRAHKQLKVLVHNLLNEPNTSEEGEPPMILSFDDDAVPAPDPKGDIANTNAKTDPSSNTHTDKLSDNAKANSANVSNMMGNSANSMLPSAKATSKDKMDSKTNSDKRSAAGKQISKDSNGLQELISKDLIQMLKGTKEGSHARGGISRISSRQSSLESGNSRNSERGAISNGMTNLINMFSGSATLDGVQKEGKHSTIPKPRSKSHKSRSSNRLSGIDEENMQANLRSRSNENARNNPRRRSNRYRSFDHADSKDWDQDQEYRVGFFDYESSYSSHKGKRHYVVSEMLDENFSAKSSRKGMFVEDMIDQKGVFDDDIRNYILDDEFEDGDFDFVDNMIKRRREDEHRKRREGEYRFGEHRDVHELGDELHGEGEHNTETKEGEGEHNTKNSSVEKLITGSASVNSSLSIRASRNNILAERQRKAGTSSGGKSTSETEHVLSDRKKKKRRKSVDKKKQRNGDLSSGEEKSNSHTDGKIEDSHVKSKSHSHLDSTLADEQSKVHLARSRARGGRLRFDDSHTRYRYLEEILSVNERISHERTLASLFKLVNMSVAQVLCLLPVGSVRVTDTVEELDDNDPDNEFPGIVTIYHINQYSTEIVDIYDTIMKSLLANKRERDRENNPFSPEEHSGDPNSPTSGIGVSGTSPTTATISGIADSGIMGNANTASGVTGPVASNAHSSAATSATSGLPLSVVSGGPLETALMHDGSPAANVGRDGSSNQPNEQPRGCSPKLDAGGQNDALTSLSDVNLQINQAVNQISVSHQEKGEESGLSEGEGNTNTPKCGTGGNTPSGSPSGSQAVRTLPGPAGSSAAQFRFKKGAQTVVRNLVSNKAQRGDGQGGAGDHHAASATGLATRSGLKPFSGGDGMAELVNDLLAHKKKKNADAKDRTPDTDLHHSDGIPDSVLAQTHIIMNTNLGLPLLEPVFVASKFLDWRDPDEIRSHLGPKGHKI